MQFLSDLYLTCPECEGARFTKAAQEILYRGKSITGVLSLTIEEALALSQQVADERMREAGYY